MLEKPNLPNERLSSCLRAFGLADVNVEFLPLGADMNTAVYRATAADGKVYFVKLRAGFDEISVALPQWLHEQGIQQIIPPLPAQNGKLWAELDAYKVILYPFIAGRDGYAVKLTPEQWREFGAALQRIHAARAPAALLERIPRETYSPFFRAQVKDFLRRVEETVFTDVVAVKTAALLQAKRAQILELIGRAEQYARELQARELEFVLCHTDLHAGNLLITPGGAFYLVDWDQPILAPKERDLMFIGGGQGFTGMTAAAEVALFYPGYGPARIDPAALGYYRCERIVQDIAAFGAQLLLTDAGGDDREQSYRYLASNFEPSGVIEIAYRGDIPY
jgi:spectinomycin phosphotransferase